ncbi:hypothetical protein ABNF97_24505 [Plantactinospora sp. B6F1]|uniref:hypothetical protein n=1 Tax=Plantactinospora sp. B6F1 TaxID=3158971 RepID=UPI0032D95BE2
MSIGAGLTGPADEVRSPDEVARALAATPPPAAPGAVPSGDLAGPVPTASGTVPGSASYRVGEVERGPDDDAEVTFHGSGGGRIEIEVECVGGRPVPTWKAHGGDD